MKPAAFKYHRPQSLAQAVSLLESLGPEARPIAGGQSLAPMINLRLAQPSDLVDLRDVTELYGIAQHDTGIEIGAMSTHQQITTSPIVARMCPMLARAAQTIAHYAIRKQGTLGGSLAHADPAAQFPLVAAALEAQIKVVGPAGERIVPARSFFEGLMSTALQPAEIIVSVGFATVLPGQGQGFRHFNRRHGDFAIAAAAADVSLDGPELVHCRLALGGVAPTPIALDALGNDYLRMPIDPALPKRIARAARAQVTPFDSPGVSAQFRSEIVEVLLEQALVDAIDQAQTSGRGSV